MDRRGLARQLEALLERAKAGAQLVGEDAERPARTDPELSYVVHALLRSGPGTDAWFELSRGAVAHLEYDGERITATTLTARERQQAALEEAERQQAANREGEIEREVERRRMEREVARRLGANGG